MQLAAAHRLAAGIVLAALLATASVFTFARPRAESGIPPGPPNDLPYSVASFTAVDARRAFATQGVELTSRSRSRTTTTLGDRRDVLEVDAFADAETVKASGFYDYIPVRGRYVHFPRFCGRGSPDAERWRGNIRVIVSCPAAGAASAAWLARVERALAEL